ncbi:hypothetical protein F4819DRAFT_305782 [Hypoxylon fuscum]|nr:hypothetical protein F4819DRAFT_305782 [Hypoxylon fuscum]
MAGFSDTLRGDGLARTQRALAGLQGDPLRLDRERQRFSHSPPQCASNSSGTTTRSASLNLPSEEQRLRQERLVQLGLEADASKPDKQFSQQINEEEKRVFEASLNGAHPIPVGSDPRTIARENVKKRWVEQGIWNSKWNQFAYGRWKHEEPLPLESETKLEAGHSIVFSPFPRPLPKPMRPMSDDEKRRIAEQRAAREREHEASRPYHQFVYQISKERERIQDQFANAPGINTMAYENVKNTWTKRGIWNKRWGILPGMSWKHEEPLEEEAVDSPAPVPANPLANGCHGEEKLPTKRIFGSRSVESSRRRGSIAADPSQQGPSADMNSAENGNSELSPSAPYSPRIRTGKRVLRPSTGQASRSSKRNPSRKDDQQASVTLGPVHSSKISKTAAKKRSGPPQQPDISQKVSPDGLPFSSGVNPTEPPPSPERITPRRSKRIHPPVPSVAEDPAETASKSPMKRAVQSKPQRKVTSYLKTKSSAKPQGTSKKPPTRTARGKAREK